jgi:hypothetical protein
LDRNEGDNAKLVTNIVLNNCGLRNVIYVLKSFPLKKYGTVLSVHLNLSPFQAFLFVLPLASLKGKKDNVGQNKFDIQIIFENEVKSQTFMEFQDSNRTHSSNHVAWLRIMHFLHLAVAT